MSFEHLRPYLEADGHLPQPDLHRRLPTFGHDGPGARSQQHPELWASKEAYVLHRIFGNGRAAGSWKHHWERSNPSWLRAEGVERAEFLGFLGLGVNAMYSSRSGGRRWVDPTPLNTLMIDDVGEMFPYAFFLHLVRDGRRVVRSMLSFRESIEREKGPIPDNEMPPWTRDFEAACESWANHVEIVARFEDANPGRCLTIRNEDLVTDPHAALSRMLDFLDAAPDDGPADFLATPPHQLELRRRDRVAERDRLERLDVRPAADLRQNRGPHSGRGGIRDPGRARGLGVLGDGGVRDGPLNRLTSELAPRSFSGKR